MGWRHGTKHFQMGRQSCRDGRQLEPPPPPPVRLIAAKDKTEKKQTLGKKTASSAWEPHAAFQGRDASHGTSCGAFSRADSPLPPSPPLALSGPNPTDQNLDNSSTMPTLDANWQEWRRILRPQGDEGGGMRVRGCGFGGVSDGNASSSRCVTRCHVP